MEHSPFILITLATALFCNSGRLAAQLIAGVVPSTHTLTEYAIHLEPLIDFTEEGASVDADCDGVDDFIILLKRENPSMDFPNRLYLRVLVDSIRICANDMGDFCPGLFHSLNYSAGDIMSCTAPFAMLNDTSVVIGDYVSFTCGGVAPQAADSAFVHFDKTKDGLLSEGWILISYDLLSSTLGLINPWADVHSVLGVCSTDGIQAFDLSPDRVTLYPNPAWDRPIRWSCSIPLSSIQVRNVQGQIVHTAIGGISGSLDLPEGPGTFFIQGRTANKILPVEKLVLH